VIPRRVASKSPEVGQSPGTRRVSDLRVGNQPTSVTFFASSDGAPLLTAAVDSPARNR
jgi:hypothetical protein